MAAVTMNPKVIGCVAASSDNSFMTSRKNFTTKVEKPVPACGWTTLITSDITKISKEEKL